MSNEAVMICLDNSEPMRNGDYAPTRLEAMIEAVNEIASAKVASNAEATVGVLSMGGSRVEVHMSPTRELGAIMTTIQKEVKVSGDLRLLSALKTAQLVLKNRPNKQQRQRIIAFVGSPVRDDAKELVKLGKMFKKNNIAVDIVNFGTENCLGEKTETPEKLEGLINAVNSNDNSHIVHIPPGPHTFSDLVLTSAIMMGSAAAQQGAQGAAGGFPGGIDPNLDPDLAMALRISQEEAKAREEEQLRAAQSASAPAGAAAAPVAMDMEDDEEALLQQAIAMSMAAEGGDIDPAALAAAASPAPSTPAPAPAASASAPAPAAAAAPAAAGERGTGAAAASSDLSSLVSDPAFISSLLESVPGVEGVNVDDILAQLGAPSKDDKKDGGNGAGKS